MAFGKPVVATRHAGIPEAVEDAYLVDENDAEGLAEVLRRVIGSPELRASIGSANRARAEGMFSSGNTLQLESILRQAANKDSR